MEEIRIALAIIGTGISCYYDIFNRKNVPEKFLYAFLIVSLLVNIFDYSGIMKNWYIAIPLIIALYLLYKIGQIGGADVFVISSIYFLIPSNNKLIPIPSIIPILAISSILFIIFLIFRYSKHCIENIGNVKISNIAQCVVIIFAYSLLFHFLSQLMNPLFIALNVLILFFICFLVIFKDIISEKMIEMRRIDEIEVEDVIAIEKIDEKIVKKLNLRRLIDNEQLKRMKKSKIKKWPIFNLPQFLPFIFISLIIYIIFGDPFFYLVYL